MKHKYLSLLFLIFSCSLPQSNLLFNSQQDVFDFISDNYHYEKIDGEPVQLPEVTLQILKGDCGDWAFLAVYLLREININAEFAACIQEEYENNYYHALVKIDNKLYESRGGRDVTNEYKISFVYSYEMTLFFRPFLQ